MKREAKELTTRQFAKAMAALACVGVGIAVVIWMLGGIGFGEVLRRGGVLAGVAAILAGLFDRVRLMAPADGPRRGPLVVAAGLAFMMILLWVVARVSLPGDSTSGMTVFMGGMMVGAYLVQAGVTRRAGESKHCPDCEYECNAPTPEEVSIHCPECGKVWLGRLITGRRVRSNRLIVIGIVTIAAGFAIMFGKFILNPLAPGLPTPALYALVYLDSKSYSGWRELAKRPLSEGWVRRMANHVLSQRGYEAERGREWMEELMDAGVMPTDLEERFYREAFEAELVVPSWVRAGEEFTAKLRVHRAGSGRGYLSIMFAGYGVDEEPAARGRVEKEIMSYDLEPGEMSLRRDVLPETLRAVGGAGEMRVRAVYWVVHRRGAGRSGFPRWGSDGTVEGVENANWVRRVEVERVVRVE